MTKSYSELQQEALFRAARDIRKVAAQVLDDVTNDAELNSIDTLTWAKKTSKRFADSAREIEEKAHEITVASDSQERANSRSKAAHSDAITRFQYRILNGPGGGAMLNAVNAV